MVLVQTSARNVFFKNLRKQKLLKRDEVERVNDVNLCRI